MDPVNIITSVLSAAIDMFQCPHHFFTMTISLFIFLQALSIVLSLVHTFALFANSACSFKICHGITGVNIAQYRADYRTLRYTHSRFKIGPKACGGENEMRIAPRKNLKLLQTFLSISNQKD